MADRSIGELSKATEVQDDSLFVMEQQGQSRSVTGALVKQYAVAAAKEQADAAKEYAEKGKTYRDEAAEKAKDAADVAIHPPILKDESDNWWIWDTEQNDYRDSGVDAGVSLEVSPETITGEPGSDAKVDNLGTKTDPVLQFTLPRGKDGADGKSGFSPTVDVQKEGKTTTVTITDEKGEHVAKILDGEDGAGKVESVNDKTGAVQLTAEDVDAYTKAEVDAKVIRFTVTLPAASWANGQQMVTDARLLADDKYVYIVDCAGAAIRADDVTAAGKMTFHADIVPTGAVTVEVIRMEVAQE